MYLPGRQQAFRENFPAAPFRNEVDSPNQAIIYLNLQATESDRIKMGEYFLSQVKRRMNHLPYLTNMDFSKPRDISDVVTDWLKKLSETKCPCCCFGMKPKNLSM